VPVSLTDDGNDEMWRSFRWLIILPPPVRLILFVVSLCFNKFCCECMPASTQVAGITFMLFMISLPDSLSPSDPAVPPVTEPIFLYWFDSQICIYWNYSLSGSQWPASRCISSFSFGQCRIIITGMKNALELDLFIRNVYLHVIELFYYMHESMIITCKPSLCCLILKSFEWQIRSSPRCSKLIMGNDI
jgi:hypothetical protein